MFSFFPFRLDIFFALCRWKDPDHELRKSDKFKLTGVPCLMKIGFDGEPTARLDEELETCKCTKDVELFVKAFLYNGE